MTREEEINNYAYNNCINDDIDDTSYSLIVETAKWADGTMIEKVYKGLEDYAELTGIDSETIKEFFKKVMEG